MGTDVRIFFTDDENQSLRDDQSASPEVFEFDSGQLPFERMGADHFELLLADLFSAEVAHGGVTWFDKASRLNDGADKGRDVMLFLNSAPVGLVQCKRYSSSKVTLDMVAKEICKFFLHAKIDPTIAPAASEEFTYIVAVADKAEGKLRDFLQDKGTSRFNEQRELFEKCAESARNQYVSLRESPILKSLDKVQLCDLVWERIDTLKTDIYKKDNLSRLVNKYPTVKSTYFKLESSAEKVIAELKELLQGTGTAPPNRDDKILSEVRTEYFERSIAETHRYNLALIQGTDTLSFLRAMLNPPDEILRSKFGSSPIIISAGAESAQPREWIEINGFVKGYPQPLILFLGCGEVTGQQLNDWSQLDDIVWPDPLWTPGNHERLKAGWCWVTDPSKEVWNCYLIVENEPGDAKLGHGKLALRLAFEDVIVWPTLGNDFVLPVTHPRAQLRRMIVSQSEDKGKRRNLVISSQHTDNIENLLEPISDYSAQRYRSPVAIVMANSGCVSDCDVKLYSATGIFPSIDSEQTTRCTPSGVTPKSRVLRRRGDGAITLTINWEGGVHIGAAWGLRKSGANIVEDLPPVALEFDELFNRYPPVKNYLSFAQNELELLQGLVQSENIKDIDSFTYRVRYGVRAGERFTVEDMTACGESLMRAFHALSYIGSHTASSWTVSPGTEGHITYIDPVSGPYNVMAWSNEKYVVRDIEGALYEWSMQAASHPNLLVFAKALGTVRETLLVNDRHNFKEHPIEARTFTEAQPPRGIYIFSLSDIESQYVDPAVPSAAAFMDEISVRRRKLDAN